MIDYEMGIMLSRLYILLWNVTFACNPFERLVRQPMPILSFALQTTTRDNSHVDVASPAVGNDRLNIIVGGRYSHSLNITEN